LVALGHEVDVVALKRRNQASYECLNGVNLYRIQERNFDEKSKLSYLVRLLRFFIKSTNFLTKQHMSRRYSFVHVHSVPDFLVFAAALTKLTGAKVILDIHDLVPELNCSKFRLTRKSIVFKALILLERLSTSFADYVIVANHIWEKTLNSRSVAKDKCSVILNYPDPTIFKYQPADKRDNEFRIIYPGSLNWYQGVDTIIKAIARLEEQLPNLELQIYGDGSAKSQLTTLVSKLGLESKVTFEASLPINEISNLMRNADLAIEPKKAGSFANEALSTKILEYMALGVPVIASDTLAHQYYFDSDLVMFFESDNEEDLANCILSLREDEGHRTKLVQNALEYIAENNWKVRQKEYLDLVTAHVGGSDF